MQCVLCTWSQNPAIKANLACLQLTDAFKNISTFLWQGDFHFGGWVVRGLSSPVQIAVIKTLNSPLKFMISKDIRASVNGCSGTNVSQAIT